MFLSWYLTRKYGFDREFRLGILGYWEGVVSTALWFLWFPFLKADNFGALCCTKCLVLMTSAQLEAVMSRHSDSWDLKSCLRFIHCKGLVSFPSRPLTPLTYEQVCNETLDSLAEYFETLVEEAVHLKAADVSYSVSNHGTFFVSNVILNCCPYFSFWPSLSKPREKIMFVKIKFFHTVIFIVWQDDAGY
jgi:hypothetical protein